MKRLFAGLVAFVSLFAVQHESYAQAFSGTYTFGTNGNVANFAYNGSAIPNLSVGSLGKSNVTTSSSGGNFRASTWPGGAVNGSFVLTGAVDVAKFFEFSLAAASGYTFDMTNLNFGIGRSATGPRTMQWRSSLDNFTSVISNYSSLGSSGLLTNNQGVLTFTNDAASLSTGINLSLASPSFQALTSITFRCYFFNSEASAGTSGLEGPFNFSGIMNNPAGSPVVSITTPATNVPFETTTISLQGTANTDTQGDLSWSNNLTGAVGAIPVATNWTIPDIALNVGANVISVVGTNSTGASSQSSVTITRNDVIPTNVQFSASAATVAEAGQVYTVTVRKTVSAGDISGEVGVSGTATPESDFTINTTNFTLNAAVTTATFEVTIVNDGDEEGPETILLTLTNVVGGTIGSPGTFTLNITGNDGTLANLIISEVADPLDAATAKFVEIYNPGTSTVNLAAGNWNLARQSNGGGIGNVALSGTISPSGTYVIGNVSNSFVTAFSQQANQYSGTVDGNGDDAYFLYFGGPHTNGTLVDIYGVLNQTGTLAWAYADGRAVRNAGVTNANTTWTASEWTLIVPANKTNMTPFVHPENIFTPTNVNFAVSSASISETGSTYLLTINKSVASGNVSGELVLGGTAILATDYTVDTTNFTMNGSTTSATVSISIIDNFVDAPNKTIALAFTNVIGADVIAPSNVTLTIFDDDLEPPPTNVIAYYTFTGETNTPATVAPNATASPLTVSAGVLSYTNSSASSWNGSGVPFIRAVGGWTNSTTQNGAKELQITVSADSGYVLTVTNVSVRCRATSAGPSAVGLTINSNSIYAANAPTGTIPSIVSQPVSGYESVASIIVGIQGWANGSRTTTGGGDLQVDDVLVQGFVTASSPTTPAVQFVGSSDTVSETNPTYQVTITKSPASGNVSGEIQLGGTAGLGTDYSVSATNFTLDGVTTSATISVSITNDVDIEGAETVIMTLTNITGATNGSPSAFTLTIDDNDVFIPPTPVQPTNKAISVVGSVVSVTLGGSQTGFSYALKYSTNLAANPQVWNTLTTSNGTGSPLIMTDTSATNAARSYQVEAFYPTDQ